jgi:hypothetical protein
MNNNLKEINRKYVVPCIYLSNILIAGVSFSAWYFKTPSISNLIFGFESQSFNNSVILASTLISVTIVFLTNNYIKRLAK